MGIACLYLHPAQTAKWSVAFQNQFWNLHLHLHVCEYIWGFLSPVCQDQGSTTGWKSSKDFHSKAGGWWHLPRDQIRLDSLRVRPRYGFYVSTQDRINRNSGKCNSEHHSWYFYKDLLLLQGPNSFIPDMILTHHQKTCSTWETLTYLHHHLKSHATLSPPSIYSLTFKCRFPDAIWFSLLWINMDLTWQSMDDYKWKKQYYFQLSKAIHC